jgi:aminoglycoside 6'-N-acetyltransferase
MSDPDEIARDGDVAIRPMRDETHDYELFVRWRNEPHVAEWWNTDDDPVPMTLEHARAEYGPHADAWVSACIIAVAERPVGFVQFYPWSDEPDEAREMGVPDPDSSYGLDIFIGEPDMVGRGVGSMVVALVARYVFGTAGANSVALLTPVGNERAHRAYERAGFRKVRQTLDSDVVDGDRRLSWLMVLDRPLG